MPFPYHLIMSYSEHLTIITPQSGYGNAVSLPLIFVGTRHCRILREYGKITKSSTTKGKSSHEPRNND